MNFINTVMKSLSLLVVSLFGLNACVASNASYENSSSYNSTYRPKPATTNSFITEKWYLTKFNNNPYQGRRITLDISTQKTINGFSGCNRYFASDVKISGNQIRFGSVGSTKRMCVDRNSSHLERRYLDALRNATSFERSNSRLVLRGHFGSMIFAKKSWR